MADYATVPEIRDAIGKSGSDKDSVIMALITAASRTIDNVCNRAADGFVADTTATARVYTATGQAWVRIDECTEISLVAVKESVSDTSYTSWAATDWVAFRGSYERPNFNRTPYDAVMVTAYGDYAAFLSGMLGNIANPTVQITAKWGYAATVPSEIKQATITQVARWLKRGESGWSDVLANAEMGQLMYQKMIDPDVKMMLYAGRYIRKDV